MSLKLKLQGLKLIPGPYDGSFRAAEGGADDQDNTIGCCKVCRMKKTTLDKIAAFFAEILGTATLVFLGCMGCIQTDLFPNNHLQMILNFGFAVITAIQCFGCISGAHINPSVTMVALIYNKISVWMALVYLVAQCLGSFIGYGLLKLLMPPNTMNVGEGLCVTSPHDDISLPMAFGIEFIITAILAFTCCGVWDPRNDKYYDSVAIRFGLIVACLCCAAGPFTGAGMNPARSLGPAIWNNFWEDHWLYWAGPLSGAATAAFGYKYAFRRQPKEE